MIDARRSSASLDRGAVVFLASCSRARRSLVPLPQSAAAAVVAAARADLPRWRCWANIVCYALLALSIDLIWGYCGILSLGHGAFFALGGYAMGMYLMRQIGTRGVYANPILPDFMVFLNWKELPVFWYGFQHFPYAALMVVLVPGALAFVFGWFAFRSRVTGVYLSIITQALTFALMLGFFRNNFGFGGNNGLTDFKDILGFNVQAQATRAALFALSCVALGLGFLICRSDRALEIRQGADRHPRRGEPHALPRLSRRELQAVRVHAVGLHGRRSPARSTCRRSASSIPSEFAPANSIEAVIWVAVGGRGTLIGAVLGAVLVNYAKTTFTTGLLAPYWLFVLGGLFVAGHAASCRKRHRRHCCAALVARARSGAPAAGGAAEPRRVQRPQAGGVSTMDDQHHRSAALSRRRHASRSTASARSTICRSRSSPARCAPSSAPTAPARPR